MARPKPTHHKSTKVELNLRVKEVQDLLLLGHTRAYIVQYGSKWKITDRQIDDYIRMATEIVKEINQVSIQDNLALIVSNLWNLYRTTSDQKSEQHKILMSIAKLKGLEHYTVKHIIEDKRDLAGVTDDDLDALLFGKTEDE